MIIELSENFEVEAMQLIKIGEVMRFMKIKTDYSCLDCSVPVADEKVFVNWDSNFCIFGVYKCKTLVSNEEIVIKFNDLVDLLKENYSNFNFMSSETFYLSNEVKEFLGEGYIDVPKEVFHIIINPPKKTKYFGLSKDYRIHEFYIFEEMKSSCSDYVLYTSKRELMLDLLDAQNKQIKRLSKIQSNLEHMSESISSLLDKE